ncbi:MAG TPA: sugar phosphate nucleotidyltransferase [Planctomycetota bacterium]
MVPLQSVGPSSSPKTPGRLDRAGDQSLPATAHASRRGVRFCFDGRPTSGRGRMVFVSPARPSTANQHRWVIVLAGGSGTRLAPLTAQPGGAVVPKQYCSLQGGRSLLGDALARAGQLAAADRVVTVVAGQHEAHWRRELAHRPLQTTVVQPQNRGTAAGILLPLLSIVRRDPDAEITLLPSDHFVYDEPRLLQALRAAQQAAAQARERVLLVGIEPEGPEPDYGWILPGAEPGPIRSVRQFVEKPDRQRAAELMRDGAVWNSFLLVGGARTILGLYERRAPQLLAALTAAGDEPTPAQLQGLYANLPDLDFCRHLLSGSEPRLGLCIAPACGWTDLGTPARVAQCAASLATRRRVPFEAGSLGAIATS